MLSGERVDRHEGVILQPQATASATPADQALTQEAFARLFFTPTKSPLIFFADTPVPSNTATLVLEIPITGPSHTPTATLTNTPISLTSTSRPGSTLPTPCKSATPNSSPTSTRVLSPSPSPTPTRTLLSTPTITWDASLTPTPIPVLTNTPISPLPTNTPIPAVTNTPKPTNTPRNTNTPRSTPTPKPTNTPKNAPTNTPIPPPPDTPVPPPTDTPIPTPGQGEIGVV